ncbi:hypothetical protein Bca101_027428 [Brassica carinata]
MRSRKKIAPPPVSNKPLFNKPLHSNPAIDEEGLLGFLKKGVLRDTFLSSLGIKAKVWTLPAAEMDSEDSDDSDEFIHSCCGYKPHGPVLSNSSAHHIKKVSVGSTIRCKVSYLRRRRRQRWAHEQKELLFRSIATLLQKNGLSDSAAVLMQEAKIKDDGGETPPDIEGYLLELLEKGESISQDMDSALNEEEEDEDESSDESDGIAIERLGIGTLSSNPAIDDGGAVPTNVHASSLASCIEEITKHQWLARPSLQ